MAEVESVSAQGTLGDMRNTFEAVLGEFPESTRGTWRFSFTELPDEDGEYPATPAKARTLVGNAETPESSKIIEMSRKK